MSEGGASLELGAKITDARTMQCSLTVVRGAEGDREGEGEASGHKGGGGKTKKIQLDQIR